MQEANVAKVFSRGELIVDQGKFLGTPGRGKIPEA